MTFQHRIAAALAVALAFPALAQRVIATVPTDTNPVAVAVNPLTNRIYVANRGSASVTVIDGATQQPMTGPGGEIPSGSLRVGLQPAALAVNTSTDRVYVANEGSGTVSVIDGESLVVASVSVGAAPRAIAVDRLRNRIYVANSGSASVTVIDGVSLATATVLVGRVPVALAVNADTNRIFTVNQGDNSVTVIDGATLQTAVVPTGQVPEQIVINPRTNRVYVLNGDGDWVSIIGTITVIDGETLATGILPGAFRSSELTIDAARNQVLLLTPNTGYFADSPGTLHLIDPSGKSRQTVTAGERATGLTVNEANGIVYVSNRGLEGSSGSVTVIDTKTLEAITLPTGEQPGPLALNPVTNRVYVVSPPTGKVIVIDGSVPAVAPGG